MAPRSATIAAAAASRARIVGSQKVISPPRRSTDSTLALGAFDGMTMKAEDFRVVFRHPRNILLGCVSQFTIMPLLAFGLGDNASIIGKTDAGLDSAPYATFANKKFYSRYILLFRLKRVGSGSNATILPEFAGVIDCCGATVRSAQDTIRKM